MDENNVHKFHHLLKLLGPYVDFPGDILLGYDQNIVKHTLALTGKRSAPLRWKYFQYLSLFFTEVYLDRFFRDPDDLLADLNRHAAAFNQEKPKKDQLPAYQAADLRKLAFWNATGSGKTLLMHVNIRQYQHYLELHGKKKQLNRIILLTPNEGLSAQHLKEFEDAGIDAELFSKGSLSLFAGSAVEIIEITKLKEDMGKKTVAIDAFEGNNLVVVDEGHRGASSNLEGAWMSARNRLCENGFSFEYSATFGQAMTGNKDLTPNYAKCILFDYSYKYFYNDGFGKDYRILNLADDSDAGRRRLYLTACLVAFYQQQKLYAENPDALRPFLLAKPLWVFVGGSVNAVRTQNKRKVSDVVDILLTLARFAKNKGESIALLRRLLGGNPGLLAQKGNEIFAKAFTYLVSTQMNAEEIFDDIMRILFNSTTQGALHVENLKGTDGEIALRLGNNQAYALINVGDASNLCKLCEAHPDLLLVTEKEFSGSLFQGLNGDNSTINVLIGSKKFTEGWNSWRVSTMGLMNIGRTEGSEIIQLFGRGVRLKGHGMALKRSGQLEDVDSPEHINLLETLNIFGIRADYMHQFKDYLEEEGLSGDDESEPMVLPVISGFKGKKLKIVRVPHGLNFKKNGKKPVLSAPPDKLLKYPLTLNWYPKTYAQQSKGIHVDHDVNELNEGKLEDKHLAFLDIDTIWFELQHFKNERGWHNLILPRDRIVRLWQEIAVALLKKYMYRHYNHERQQWEAANSEYFNFAENDPNFISEYRVRVERSQTEIIAKLRELKILIKDGSFNRWEFGNLSAFRFEQHLYRPLLHFTSNFVQVSPVSLNKGETDFVMDLRTFYQDNPKYFRDRELYLLRNMSRGRGIGFFEAGNFYPDFILWLFCGQKQYVSFVDPKGIRNLEGPNDPKIRFCQTIKELEARLADPNVVLNSFIISNTPFRNVEWWTKNRSKEEFGQANVLFQVEDKDRYIGTLFSKIAPG